MRTCLKSLDRFRDPTGAGGIKDRSLGVSPIAGTAAFAGAAERHFDGSRSQPTHDAREIERVYS